MSIRIGVILLVISILVVCLIPGWSGAQTQPINYSHKVHVQELEIACEDCHSNVEQNARALIPNVELCGACHVDTEAEKQDEREVAILVEKGERIPWTQVHVVPDYAYFSHRRHVTLGQLQCELCHGDVSQMEEPFTKPSVSMDMEWCMECHEQRGASNDCYACHR
jgi:Zn finger protein HypA/HybF involved in hydrogenase expression